MKLEKKALFDAFNAEYLQEIPLVSFKWYGSQTATVMALQFGMVADDDIQSVVNGLAFDIEAEKGVHHATGIHGSRYIYSVLNNYGKADLAHRILTTPTFPSQTYVMNLGFTTWPERQFYWDAMPHYSNSLNHPMNSGFAAYFFEILGGIQTTIDKPGFREFWVNPVFQLEITETSVTVPTPYGDINNSWEMENSKMTMNLEVPFNTKAKLVLSSCEMQKLKINDLSWNDFKMKNASELLDGSTIVLGSGVYEIEYVK